ncbi:hypothetical protein [Paenibacillus tundrae]|uniref:Uncharacterized protein n=1 Tax=Paenibacillus tundrae TaxID=528187 RepID=A0ABT9W741_9BACL|nr:hypothetical protein [Paenibacillus tundrae]MDQ0169049.1 hypothetical protein [Paenibacillus tundrae]
MNQQLSRMKTYGSQRHRNLEQKEKSEPILTPEVSMFAETAVAVDQGGAAPITAISLPRSKRKPLSASLESPVLPSRAPARSKTSQKQNEEESVSEAGSLPTRTELHPSRRLRLSKRFVNSLILLFVLLTASLVWWGVKGAPPLHTFLPWPG